MNTSKRILLVICFSLSWVIAVTAQTKQELIQNIAKDIEANYINKQIAKQLADSLNYKFKTHQYDTTLSKDAFLYQVLKDIRRQSKDKHFFLAGANAKAPKKKQGNLKKTFIDRFYYSQVQVWDNNIAYLAFDNFQDQSYTPQNKQKRQPLHLILQSIKDLDTIVVDLRYNRGGKVYMAAYFIAHFLSQPKQYLFTVKEYSKKHKKTIEIDFKTPTIKIKPLVDKKIYILTSQYTFSAAELAVYGLKKYLPNLETIGEKTAGGANGHLGKQYKKGYLIQIPSFSTFDKENKNYTWEGKGIEPNIYSSLDSALVVLVQKIRKKKGNIKKTEIRVAQTKKIKKTQNTQQYIGNYSIAQIIAKNGHLYLQYDTKPPTLLIPKQKPLVFCTLEFKSIRFELHQNQEIKGIYIERNDGYTEYYQKNMD